MLSFPISGQLLSLSVEILSLKWLAKNEVVFSGRATVMLPNSGESVSLYILVIHSSYEIRTNEKIDATCGTRKTRLFMN